MYVCIKKIDICSYIYVLIHTSFYKYANTYISLSLYIYIYIYIYCHPQTDCFIVSQLFSVARHVGC